MPGLAFVWPRQSSNACSKGLSTFSSRVSHSVTGNLVGSTLEAGQLPTGGGLEALLEGGGGPIVGAPGEVSEVGTEKVKQDQANIAEIGKKLNSTSCVLRRATQ